MREVLSRLNFEPDIVLVYGNPPQIMRFIAASIMEEGGCFENSFFAPGVCADIIAPVIQTRKCRFGIPDFGNRKHEYTANDELIFSIPFARLEEIAEGLEFFYKNCHSIPSHRSYDHPSLFSETYQKLRALL